MKQDPRSIYPGTQGYGVLNSNPYNPNVNAMSYGQFTGGPAMSAPPPPVAGFAVPTAPQGMAMTSAKPAGPTLSSLFV